MRSEIYYMYFSECVTVSSIECNLRVSGTVRFSMSDST